MAKKISPQLTSPFFIIGIIIIIATLIVAQLVFTVDKKKEITNKDALCNAKIGNFNIGEAGQKLLGKEDECNKIYYQKMFIDYAWILYILGLVLIGISFIPKKK